MDALVRALRRVVCDVEIHGRDRCRRLVRDEVSEQVVVELELIQIDVFNTLPTAHPLTHREGKLTEVRAYGLDFGVLRQGLRGIHGKRQQRRCCDRGFTQLTFWRGSSCAGKSGRRNPQDASEAESMPRTP